MNFVTVAANTFHYRQEGTPMGRPLVFINSLGTDLRLWDGVVSSFTARFRILRYDLRGHGLSDTPPGPYTIQDHVNDLAGLLNQLGIQSAILVGNSIGGLIAMSYALHNPGRAHALVLCDTAAKIGTHDSWTERIRTVREQSLAALAETLTGRWFTPALASRSPAELRGYINLLARMPMEGYLANCAALRDADLQDQVSTLGMPCLVLCGTEDVVTTVQTGRELAASLPRGRFEALADAAHLPTVEQPQAVLDAIQRFFKESGYV